MQKKAFITGSTGLLGAKLVFDLYEKHYQVYALKRKNTPVDKMVNSLKFYTNTPQKIIDSINWVNGDILDSDILSQHITADMDIYHCAAMVSFNPKNTLELTEVNVNGTAILVNVCVEKKVRKFCHVSSIGALGSSVNGKPIDTDSQWIPNGKSPYSKSKYYSEMEVWRGIAEGLNSVIVNPAVILGCGDWESSSATFFSRVNKGMNYYTLGTTGFVYVNDVSCSMIQLMESEVSSERFILSEDTYSYKYIFESIAKDLGVKSPQKKATSLHTAIAWRFETFRTFFTKGEPLITKYSHKTAHSYSNYNGKPITQTINFKYTSISKAIEIIAQKFQK